MKGKFIYAFQEKDKNDLIQKGFQLVFEKPDKQRWIFENKDGLTFDTTKYLITDTITF